ncbi:MAG: DNA-binding response regulator [Chloroflexi bacterium]|nr:MAG: DNA-binding response regulator [Chloroflexota bacterium]
MKLAIESSFVWNFKYNNGQQKVATIMELAGIKILIVDDDLNLGSMVELLFYSEGAIVYRATDGPEGLKQFYKHQPDVVILDVLMPGLTGWQVCQQIRQLSDTPVIMLTTLKEDQDIVRGLEHGADDYVIKPFSTEVLKARVKALLRRIKVVPEQKTAASSQYDDGYLSIDLEKRRVFVKGESVKISATELKLLAYLLINAGHVLSYQQILNHVWGPEYQDNTDYVHVYVSHLRRKLENNASHPIYFLTEHGMGYRFEKQTHMK